MSEGPSPDDQIRAEPGAGERTCVSCGAPLAPDQDWCLRCGSGKTTGRSGPGWRSAAAAVGVATVLALGAAAAAYAAFKGEPSAGTPPGAVAQTPPATTTTTTTTTTSSATTPAVITPEAGLPAEHKPPKIPATSSTPQTGGTTSEEGGSSSNEQTGASSERERQQKSESSESSKEARRETEEQTCSSSSAGESETSTQEASELESETSSTQTTGTETQAEEAEAEESCTSEGSKNGSKSAPIQLSAQDASSYDPNAYPETGYVGPELAVDGNASTAWTAAPAPEIAPKVQAGLLIDLTRERQIAKVALISRTLGMTVAIYGTTQRTAPKSIESKGWVKLSGVHLVEQRSSTIKLKRTPKIRQLLVWVLRAPEVEPQVEGEVVEESAAINELALYEPLR